MAGNSLQRWQKRSEQTGRAISFTSRGEARGLRSAPGAPQADSPQGLTPIQSPVDRASADTTWGERFKGNSVYGSRNDAAQEAVTARNYEKIASGDPNYVKEEVRPYGTAGNPLVIGAAERDAIAARRAPVIATPFMPDQIGTPLRLPDMKLSPTDASGDAAALARNQAMTAPGGLVSYQQPTIAKPITADSTPNDIHRSVIADLEKWHADMGVPLPSTPVPGRQLPGTSDEALNILKRYRTKGTASTYSGSQYNG